MANVFKKAVKGLKPLKLVFSGATGSGKSYTSLLLATYLAKRTGKPTLAIDTENGRLSLYADLFDFDVIEATVPFDPRKLVELIKEAESEGAGQLIIDSTTHYYAGTGGLLEIVNDAAKNRFNGNTYMAWSIGTPIHNKMVETILQSKMHILITSRAKQHYVEGERNGKKTYEKQGSEMVQRDGLDYEFDFHLKMDMDNNAYVEKGMTLVPPGTYFKKPGDKGDNVAFDVIMSALEKNSQEGVARNLQSHVPETSSIKPADDETVSLRSEIVTLAKACGGSADASVMEVMKKYEPNAGNPARVTDVSQLKLWLTDMETLKTNKENK